MFDGFLDPSDYESEKPCTSIRTTMTLYPNQFLPMLVYGVINPNALFSYKLVSYSNSTSSTSTTTNSTSASSTTITVYSDPSKNTTLSTTPIGIVGSILKTNSFGIQGMSLGYSIIIAFFISNLFFN